TTKPPQFPNLHRPAHAPAATVHPSTFIRLAEAIGEFATWYNRCGGAEPTTGDPLEDLPRGGPLAREAAAGPLTGRRIAELLFQAPPTACKRDETAFKQWGRKGKWKEAAKG